MNITRDYRRGDIYTVRTGTRMGARSRAKAMLLLQNDSDEFYSTSVLAVPIAMKPSPPAGPDEDVSIYLTSMSLVLCGQCGAVDKRSLTDYIGKLDSEQLEFILFLLREQAGLYIPEAVEAP